MISVGEAKHIVQNQKTQHLKTETVPIQDALGKTLAKDALAPVSLPSFRQSAMDGYALCIHEHTAYLVIGEVQAGDAKNPKLQPGQAVRIFTGARIPDDANAVVIQERVERKGNQLILESKASEGAHIRNVGDQIKEGSVTLEKGHKINAASLGLLISLGLEHVSVLKSIKACIVVTGNELVESGKSLEEGQIYESNSVVIAAALSQKGITEIETLRVKDSLEETQKALGEALERVDLLLISGGISVGDYDFVGTALRNLGVQELFYKVLQKPGKPLFFGKKADTFVFALPGNPASTLTCFYVYVGQLIDQWMDRPIQGLLEIKVPLATSFHNRFSRSLFLKGRIENGKAHVLDHQNSSTLISFAEANALIFIPTEQEYSEENQLVTALLLPHGS